MPSALKLGVQKGFHHIQCLGKCDESRGQAEDIGIVVFPGQLGDFLVPAKSAPDFLVFVYGHGGPVATATDHDAKIHLSLFHIQGNGMGEIRVVHGVHPVGPIIYHLDPLGFEQAHNGQFVFRSRMIVSNGYFHGKGFILSTIKGTISFDLPMCTIWTKISHTIKQQWIVEKGFLLIDFR